MYLCMFYLHSDSMEHLTFPTYTLTHLQTMQYVLSTFHPRPSVNCFLLGWPLHHLISADIIKGWLHIWYYDHARRFVYFSLWYLYRWKGCQNETRIEGSTIILFTRTCNKVKYYTNTTAPEESLWPNIPG
jgi:hypothetical protein